MRRTLVITFACLALISCSGSGGGSPGSSGGSEVPRTGDPVFQPLREAWEANMIRFGEQHCNEEQIREVSTWEGGVWYYDGIRAYHQIAEYTGDSSWYACADYVKGVYRNYVLQSQNVPGWRVFPHGLYMDYQRTGEDASREAIIALATKSAFSGRAGGASQDLSRETAYLIHAYLTAEEVGGPIELAPGVPAIGRSVEFALGHIDQWAGSQSARFVQPFMIGLTLEALIRYHARTGDGRIPGAVRQAADWLWDNMWNSQSGTFPYIVCKPGSEQYQDCQGSPEEAAADLNMLIAPAYAWLYATTGEQQYAERGDAIFQGGLQGAYLNGGKQFSQNYRWSFDYVRWRLSR